MTDRMAETGATAPSGRYAPWEGVYSVSLPVHLLGNGRRSRKRSAAVALLAVVAVAVVVGLAVGAVVALVRGDPLELLDVLTSPNILLLLFLWACWRWPPQTRVTADALEVRTLPWSTRSVPWAEVVEVTPPGRFDEHPVARLAGGERLALAGLPVGVAREMAEVTTPPRPAPRAAATPRQPAPDNDLDGPFHRGRPAR